MAVTILQSPQQYTPAQHPVIYLMSSTNINKAGFGYVASVFDWQGNYLAPYDTVKRPDNGYGVTNLSDVLSAYVDHETDLIPGASGFIRANNFAKHYTFWVGEKAEYWSFGDSFYGPSGRVLFSSTTNDRHDFVIGDRVLVSQTHPFLYSQWEDEQVVMDVPDDYSFTIDQGFASGPTTPGKVRHLNGSSVVFSGMASGTGVVFGSTFYREEWTAYNQDHYIPSSTTASCGLLTNLPDGFRMASDSQAFLPVPNLPDYLTYQRVRTFDAQGNQLGVYGWQIPSEIRVDHDNRTPFVWAPFGPDNLRGTYNTWQGPTSNILSGVSYYLVGYMENSNAWDDPVIATREMRIDIDDRCTQFEKKTVLFLDTKGAWIPWTFSMKHTEEHKIKKDTIYRGDYGEIVGAAYTFRNHRRGYDVIHATHTRSFDLRTDWLTDDESHYFSELVSSPKAFLIKDRTTFLPIILDDKTEKRLRIDQDDEVMYTLSFSMAYNEPMQV